ncbi:TPA: DUF4368 domain-containing protein [Enterococcus faecalis]|nr:DUF4368 domain-containing protein [Enterococcus faecalis]HAP4810181.1 DUF4368 domain-containing protein [Enterococcus faecalis]
MGIIKKYFEPIELTHEIVRELIEKIDSERYQTVKIHYHFLDELTF